MMVPKLVFQGYVLRLMIMKSMINLITNNVGANFKILPPSPISSFRACLDRMFGLLYEMIQFKEQCHHLEDERKQNHGSFGSYLD